MARVVPLVENLLGELVLFTLCHGASALGLNRLALRIPDAVGLAVFGAEHRFGGAHRHVGSGRGDHLLEVSDLATLVQRFEGAQDRLLGDVVPVDDDRLVRLVVPALPVGCRGVGNIDEVLDVREAFSGEAQCGLSMCGRCELAARGDARGTRGSCRLRMRCRCSCLVCVRPISQNAQVFGKMSRITFPGLGSAALQDPVCGRAGLFRDYCAVPVGVGNEGGRVLAELPFGHLRPISRAQQNIVDVRGRRGIWQGAAGDSCHLTIGCGLPLGGLEAGRLAGFTVPGVMTIPVGLTPSEQPVVTTRKTAAAVIVVTAIFTMLMKLMCADRVAWLTEADVRR